MALAGLLSACRLKGEALTDQTVVVAGAGAGGIGVAAAIKSGMIRAGLTPDAAQARIFVIDAHGLVVKGRTSDAYKSPLAQDPDIYRDWGVAAGQVPSLQEVIAHAKPSVLLGLSGVAGLFSREIVTDLAGFHAQPIIFPLSNPTDNCEANPQDLLNWSEGRAIVATGSPFPDASYGGRQYPVGQGNNAFIFPGLGLAATLAECSRISDEMVQEAAYALADYTAEHWLDAGLIYPPVADLKKVCQSVAKRVLAQALRDGSASRTDLNDTDLAAYIESASWRAEQLPFKYEPA